MTGNEMITEFDGIAANDLDPLASTTAAKLVLLNTAARRIMRALKIIARDVPLSYVTGTTRYTLKDLLTPLEEVNRVKWNDAPQMRSQETVDKGWFQTDEYLDLFMDADNGDLIYLDGYITNNPIVASSSSITDIPEELQLAVVQLAIVEGCVAHEDDPQQLLRLQRLNDSAMSKVNRRVAKNASVSFPFVRPRR